MTRKPTKAAKAAETETGTPGGAPEEPRRWFLADGTPYKGLDFRDDKNKPFGEMDVSCGKCRGSGKRRFGRRRFGHCQECGGKKTTFEQVRIYSEAEITRKETKRIATRRTLADKASAKREAALARWEFWCTENSTLVSRAREADDEWINGVLISGEVYGSLTTPQVDAIRRKLVELDAERRACIGSKPLGNPKDRIEIEVTCRRRGSFMGKAFGRGRGSREVFVTEMLDDKGNALISITENFKLAKGDKALIKATVKEHEDKRKPWPVTVLTRVAILRLDLAPEAEEEDNADYEADIDASLPPLGPDEEARVPVDHGEGMNLPF